MRKVLALLLLLAPSAFAVTRDISFAWEQSLLDVDGNAIEKIDGFRVFTSAGVFVQLIPGTARQASVRINLPWGESCYKMRSFYLVGTTEYESADSNISCRTIVPGKPQAPVLK